MVKKRGVNHMTGVFSEKKMQFSELLVLPA